MSHCKPLLIPWLREHVNSNKYPGVQWTNPERTEFSIPWKHALRQDSSDADILIFKAWAEVSGNGRPHGDTSVWKRNFRSALRAKGFKLVSDNKNDNANPHKVFRWPEESPSAIDSTANNDILQDCLQGLNIGPETEGTAGFEPSPEQQRLQPQAVIGGCVLPGQQQYPVTFEGAAGEDQLPEQPAHPKEEAEGGACGGQLAEQFIHTMNMTSDGDHFKTQFRVSVYYRGVKVLEQLVENEAGVRLVYRPDLLGPVLDPKSGLHMVSLPSPGFILDQKQAELTQRILDNLGNGLDVGVLGHVVYGLRRGEVKAFWSISRFDQSRTPQEVSKLEPQPLYLFKDFIQGILDFVNGRDSPPYSLFLCLGEKWPDPDSRPWEKKLITVEVVLTSMELLKNMAIAGGASSLQSVELQISLEEMMEMC
ncbi:interferon regulatory factor 3 isoform X2 [Takifugu rubripes]|uniref:interferon regulatory factor 3 isoform X2 n=1 Tax=Takifugu rubripes TaxID=31033 RepID=UPI0005D13B3E|nr:interferon regulatory factor 3 isoform X2 [Takifugu rubripes]|eukprot:XP_011601457.1 PREDICTED: interferon regulatory factor 3 isoform X2 [Takifugu rubripes]